MRRSWIFVWMTVFILSGASALTAETITSNAPELPDMGGGLSADMPLPALDLPGFEPAPAAATSPEQAAPAQAAAPAAEASAPTPEPTATPVPATTVVTTEPTPTMVPTEAPVAAANPVTTAPAEAGAATVVEGLEAYFPMKVGAKWEYRSMAGQTRVMECMSRDSQGEVVSGTFKVSTAGAAANQVWKLAAGKIVLESATTKLRAGWVRLQEPKGKTVPRWVYDRRDGTASYYKQEVGAVVVKGKKYADGLTVTERTLKGSEQVSLRKWFYAKGVGLVSEAAYDEAGTALPDQTFHLVTP